MIKCSQIQSYGIVIKYQKESNEFCAIELLLMLLLLLVHTGVLTNELLLTTHMRARELCEYDIYLTV